MQDDKEDLLPLTLGGTLIRMAVGALLGFFIGSFFQEFVLPNVEGPGEAIAFVCLIVSAIVAGLAANRLLIRLGLR